MLKVTREQISPVAQETKLLPYDVVALVLQGGGALGAYQAGVYEGMHEAGIRCRYLHWHHWAPVSTPDGERYIACSVCHKDHSTWANTNPNIVPAG